MFLYAYSHLVKDAGFSLGSFFLDGVHESPNGGLGHSDLLQILAFDIVKVGESEGRQKVAALVSFSCL